MGSPPSEHNLLEMSGIPKTCLQKGGNLPLHGGGEPVHLHLLRPGDPSHVPSRVPFKGPLYLGVKSKEGSLLV